MVQPMTPRCYVCGEPVEAKFCLAAMQDNLDRVFIVHTPCSKRMDAVLLLPVSRDE